MKQSFTALAAPPRFFSYEDEMIGAPEKMALRERMRGLRRSLAVEVADAARRVAANVPAELNGGVFSLYRPMGGEIDPSLIGLAGGVRSLPLVIERHQPLIFREWNPGDPMEPDALGIPGPAASARAVEPDVIFAPVLAFDRQGGRLGQGGGFYDRTIAALRKSKSVQVIGVAFSGQELSQVPMGPHDERLDAILTETEYVAFG